MKDESIIPRARGSLAAGAEEAEEGGSSRRRTVIEADSKNRSRRVALMLNDASIGVKCQTIGLHRSQSTFFFTTGKFAPLKKITFLLHYLQDAGVVRVTLYAGELFLKCHLTSV